MRGNIPPDGVIAAKIRARSVAAQPPDEALRFVSAWVPR